MEDRHERRKKRKISEYYLGVTVNMPVQPLVPADEHLCHHFSDNFSRPPWYAQISHDCTDSAICTIPLLFRWRIIHMYVMICVGLFVVC